MSYNYSISDNFSDTVYTDSPSLTLEYYFLEAFSKAEELGARVINCSWGGSSLSENLENKIEELKNKGIVIVFASGNGDIFGNAIDLDINVKSNDIDGSETFTVIISDIPSGASIYYNGIEVVQNPTGAITIENFNNTTPLQVVPTHNSDENFNLKIKGLLKNFVNFFSNSS